LFLFLYLLIVDLSHEDITLVFNEEGEMDCAYDYKSNEATLGRYDGIAIVTQRVVYLIAVWLL
jgi:hypothetical protein